jgi:hypothetical protein
MAVFLEVLVTVLVVVFLGVATLALALGLAGGLTGELFERCSNCGRYGLTVDGVRHEGGECPAFLPRRAVELFHRRREHPPLVLTLPGTGSGPVRLDLTVNAGPVAAADALASESSESLTGSRMI